MNQVCLSTETVFDQLQQLLTELNAVDYSLPLTILSGNTIGKHVRHIIEMYQCLLKSYDTGILDYDQRERNTEIENNKIVAIEIFHAILNSIENKENASLILNTYYDAFDLIPEKIQTNFHRELAFSLEHCIHHMAIIRIAVEANFSYIKFSPSFGVASSTLRHIKQCAQ
ncbi:MAG: hypothetical protein ORN56_00975 [Chitinophagales bacterium]|nr:hypothetical protein [Chitinophagales bacterium]